MEIAYKPSFEKKLLKMPKHVQETVFEIIEDLEKAKSLGELKRVEKIAGFKDFYAMRLELQEIDQKRLFELLEELERLTKELEYNKGFLKSVLVKLSNEKFVANAKSEIIAIERKKESDALSKIKTIEEQLAALN